MTHTITIYKQTFRAKQPYTTKYRSRTEYSAYVDGAQVAVAKIGVNFDTLGAFKKELATSYPSATFEIKDLGSHNY